MIKANVGRDNHHEAADASEYRDAFSNLSKSGLVQLSKIFNEKKLKDSDCIDLLNKVVYLLNQVSDTITVQSILSII